MSTMRFHKSGSRTAEHHHHGDEETPWMSNAMCGMSEGQARLISKWSDMRNTHGDHVEERDEPDQQVLSTALVEGCVSPYVNSRRSPRQRRDSSPKSVSSSRSHTREMQQSNGKTAAEAMRALQAMAQKHEEYKGQISHLKQQLSFVLGKSRTNERGLKDDELAKKHRDAQDLIFSLKQELSSVQEKYQQAEEKNTAMHEKMKVISKKHEDYVEQISSLKQQLTSAESEKDKSKEESLDMVNNFDFIAKKNEKYREQIITLKKQISQAQDEALAAKESEETLQKEITQLKADNESLNSIRNEVEELNKEKEQFTEKESKLQDELKSAQNKSKKDEEKIMKLYGKIQEMIKGQKHEQERIEKQKDTINSLSRQLESIHGEYKAEIDKLRLKEKERVGRYYRTLCFNSLLLGFVLVVCLLIPAWLGATLYGSTQALYLSAMGGANLLVAAVLSIKVKRQVTFKRQPTTQTSVSPAPPKHRQSSDRHSKEHSSNTVSDEIKSDMSQHQNQMVTSPALPQHLLASSVTSSFSNFTQRRRSDKANNSVFVDSNES